MINKFLLFLTSLTLGIASAAAGATDWSQQSRLASGKWVKIRTEAEGIYQLTYDQLKELGFENPKKVQVYGYGGIALTALNNSFKSDFPDDVQPVATMHTADNRILFFGQGDAYIRSSWGDKHDSSGSDSHFTKVRNPYDTASYYFLSDCNNVSAIPAVEIVAKNSNSPLKSHIHVDFIEPEVQNVSNGSVFFHGEKRSPGDKVNYTFLIKNFQSTTKHPYGSFFFKYGINSANSGSFSASLPETLTKVANDPNEVYPRFNGIDDGLTTFNEATGNVGFERPSDGEYTFTVNVPNSDFSYCAEDFAMVRYPRANLLDDSTPFLIMNFPNGEMEAGQEVRFDNADADMAVWDISSHTPAAFTVKNGTFTLNGKNTAAVAFRPSKTFESPEIVGEIANQNIHGRSTPDMVIITVAAQEKEALELAAIHKQYQDMDVMVVVQDKVFNEFSSGTRDAMGYRRMAKMFYDRDPQKFRYLMFMGPVSYDNRCISGQWVDRLVLFEMDIPEVSNSIITNYATDIYFGMLQDNYNHNDIHLTHTQINVGRVPSVSPGEAATYVAKVRDRFENPLPAEVFSHVLLMAGTGDNATHSRQANEVIKAVREGTGESRYGLTGSKNSAISFSPVYGEAYAPTNAKAYYNATNAGLNRGAGLMAYIGHGSPTSVYGWGISQVTTTHYTYAPFVLFSSCDQFAFDHSSNGLVHTMLFTENGGALGGVAAIRSVYIDQNQMTAVPLAYSYAIAKPGDTFGDVFRRSRDLALDQYEKNPSDFRQKGLTFRNIMAYNLAGDPAIPIGVPEFAVKINELSQVKPFEAAPFTGTITKNNATDGSYNGQIRIDVFDGNHSSNTYNYNGEANYNPNTVSFDNEVLVTAYGDVVNGKFSVNVAVPTPAFPADTYRVVVSATSDKGNAIGFYDTLTIGDFDPDKFEQDEFSAPAIHELYADTPTFQPGDEVNAQCTVYAVIDPSTSGLNYMTGNVNTRTRVTVDGTSSYNNLEGFLTRRDDGKLQLAAPLKELSDGMHTIELCVVNNAGMIARESIEVLTTRRSLASTITVEESPATTVATIDVTDAGDYSRLIITDANGNTVHTVENPTFPFKWDIEKTIPNGLYNASVLVKNGNEYGSTPRASITVLR